MTDEQKERWTKSDAHNPFPALPTDRAAIERHPELAMALLEPDQVVFAKRRARFGRRPIRGKERALLWVLRVYVVAMQLLVLITVIRAFRAGH